MKLYRIWLLVFTFASIFLIIGWAAIIFPNAFKAKTVEVALTLSAFYYLLSLIALRFADKYWPKHLPKPTLKEMI